MSQNPETIFCKCFICKGEHPELGGKIVSIGTFRRHRKKESTWSNSTSIQNIISSAENLEFLSNSCLNLNIDESNRNNNTYGEQFQNDFQNDLIMNESQYNSSDEESQNNNEEESQNNNSSDEESQNNNEDEESQNNNSSDEESQNNNSSDEELQNDNSSDKDEESQINNSSDEESPNEDELQDYYMREIQEYEYNYDMQEVLFQDDESSGSLFLNNGKF
ncbi:unnamed protein product [Rhizophagus irregularis]|nr:unnamed protein product [Rhizophagus irregularis]CAB5215724.1 unnamed protein product [Rhizophagus irregularis]CAB5217563.1 unnamed protein product [Rhizophagus irregularis]CAB5396454.1 unnamed protein product [Rhizophagus irregularis]